MTCGIYEIVSPSGKSYVGKSKNIERRWHNYKLHGTGRLLGIEFAKYGAENCELKILEATANDKQAMNERERYWIDFLQTMQPNGCNILAGGDGFDSEYVKAKNERLVAANKHNWQGELGSAIAKRRTKKLVDSNSHVFQKLRGGRWATNEIKNKRLRQGEELPPGYRYGQKVK